MIRKYQFISSLSQIHQYFRSVGTSLAGSKSRMKIKLLSLVTVGLMALSGVANAVTLGQLISDQGTISIGDKTFSGFGIVATGDNQGVIDALNAQAAGLDVSASIVGGVYYLDFSGQIFVDNLLGTANLHGDLKLSYTVSADPGVITMIDQLYTPNAVGGTGQLIIGETVAAGGTVLANSTLSLDPSDLSDPEPERGDDLLVGGEHVLNVVKDIQITAFAGAQVGLSDVQQSFHQDVPDGGMTLVLLGAAVTCVGFVRRKMSL